MSYFQLIAQGDAVSRLVALLLLGMSVASWVVILWKGWLLPRARTDVARSVAAFWQSASLADARQRLETPRAARSEDHGVIWSGPGRWLLRVTWPSN